MDVPSARVALLGTQVLPQPHMQSSGSRVAVSPMPRPTAPITRLITCLLGVALSEIQATSLCWASVQSSVLTAVLNCEPIWLGWPPSTTITYSPLAGRAVTTVIGNIANEGSQPIIEIYRLECDNEIWTPSRARGPRARICHRPTSAQS